MSQKNNYILSSKKGFTAIEMLVVVCLIGLMAVLFYPSLMNTLETRALENTAKDILTTLQGAKFQAVKTRLNHRVRFAYSNGRWLFFIERENSPNTWSLIRGFVRKRIPPKFLVNVNFPSQTVVFSPLGIISNFDSQRNSVSLKSTKLEKYSQPDRRNISVFAGGAIRYFKS